MSIETDFKTLLAGYAPLASLVATRIAHAALPAGSGYPCVVYTTSHQIERGLDGTVHSDVCTLTVSCWATAAPEAEAVAEAVSAAIVAANPANDITELQRDPAYDEELGLDGVTLAVEWIVT